MKAVTLNEFGGPEQLKIEEIPTPEPADRQVLVKVNAFGVNRAEVAARVGKYPIPKELPIRLGFEAAGVVEKTGPGVTGYAPGDRVSVIPRGGEFPWHGTYAEYCLVPENGLVRTPENLSDIESAAVWMAYLTVWSGVVRLAQAKPGETLLVTAASSSLGAPAFQVARREGMRSIALTRSTHKVEQIKQLGADYVIDTSTEDIVERVKDITNGKGADIAFDCVAGPGIANIIKSLGFGARIVLYGTLDSRPMEIKPMALMVKEMSMYAHMIFHAMEDLELRRQGAEYVSQGIRDEAFKPVIAKTFEFNDIAKAHEYMQSNQQVGKIVVTVA